MAVHDEKQVALRLLKRARKQIEAHLALRSMYRSLDAPLHAVVASVAPAAHNPIFFIAASRVLFMLRSAPGFREWEWNRSVSRREALAFYDWAIGVLSAEIAEQRRRAA